MAADLGKRLLAEVVEAGLDEVSDRKHGLILGSTLSLPKT